MEKQGSLTHIKQDQTEDITISQREIVNNSTMVSLISKEDNTLQEKYKTVFIVCVAITTFGGFYNYMFQSNMKLQFLSSMNFNNQQYSLLVAIPPLPSTLVPILAGPILDRIGIRKGILFFSTLVVLGMVLIYISSFNCSFSMILIGKIMLQLGIDNLHLTQTLLLLVELLIWFFCSVRYFKRLFQKQAMIVTKWFLSNILSTVLTVCSLVMKLSVSVAGLTYPILYEVKHDMNIPFLVGILACLFSLISAIIVAIIDRNSDLFKKSLISNSETAVGEGLLKRQGFQFKIIKEFPILYWSYVTQTFLLWGSFYAFFSYLQPILIQKFGFETDSASLAISIVTFVALATPIFGYLSDRFAKRAEFLSFATFLGVISILLFFILPQASAVSSEVGAYSGIFLLGMFFALLGAYLLPSIPLLIPKQHLGTAFGIVYSLKNVALSLFSYIGGLLMGDDDSGYQNLLIFILVALGLSLVISISTQIYDRSHRRILDQINLSKI